MEDTNIPLVLSLMSLEVGQMHTLISIVYFTSSWP